MNRTWITWLAFAGCASGVLGFLGWLSLTTIRLEHAQFATAHEADREERVRLALWRLDSALLPLVVEESARPSAAYQAFSQTTAAATKTATTKTVPTPAAPSVEELVPSPLVGFSSSNILLHFQFQPGRPPTSPQVPGENFRHLAVPAHVSSERLAVAAARLEQLQLILGMKASPGNLTGPPAMTRANPQPETMEANGAVLVRETAATNQLDLGLANLGIGNAPPGQFSQAKNDRRQIEEVQSYRNAAEFVQRANRQQQFQQRVDPSPLNSSPLAANLVPDNFAWSTPAGAASKVSAFRAVWLGPALVLARRVTGVDGVTVQGAWLNWTNLRPALLAEIADLLPDADLQPAPSVAATTADDGARRLTALPVKLVARPEPPLQPGWTPFRVTLAMAWVGVIVGALAVALLLHGTVALSERRAAFVAAVTHELRTPLMTFRMYSEMLAEGMVTDEGQRRHYLTTLCSESERLSHLVENVLAYARLERSRAQGRREILSVTEMLGRLKPRLAERAELAGLTLLEASGEEVGTAQVEVDVSVVEQILFNLVDNACNYAAPTAREKTLELKAETEDGRWLVLRLRDHGPGISASGRKRLFQPFAKTADEAAQTAPGVGLGLALSRRLSRCLGGDLRWEEARPSGACFVLRLPLAQGAAQAQA